MKFLAIETSCDETAVSVLECSGDAHKSSCAVLGSGLYSQVAKHAQFGGVYPNLAKREHQLNLTSMLEVALKESGLSAKYQALDSKQIQNLQTMQKMLEREETLFENLRVFLTENPANPGFDAIAVTQGPGLEPALWVGINFAKALSFFWNIPLVPINHMEGHILSVLMDREESSNNKAQSSNVEFPAIALLVSGGHTELILVRDWGTYELIGQTRDDAVGEAFDKVARLLGLPYPGGPQISRIAQESRAESVVSSVRLPRPMIDSDNFDFSFAGLKTAVLYAVKKLGTLSDKQKKEIALEFENAAVEVLVSKTQKALEHYNAPTLIIGGGVVANTYLREEMKKMLSAEFPDVALLLPTHELSTDNAVMIGIAGYIAYEKNPDQYGVFSPEHGDIRARGTLRLTESLHP